MYQQKGFTLIELLVVIAIIAILAAILFPVLTNAKETARESGCCANLKQIGTAFSLYVDEYNGRYPAGARYRTTGEPQIHPLEHPTVCTWDVAIYKYVKNIKVFHCPSDVYKRPNVSYTSMKPSPRSYSLNDQPLWNYNLFPSEGYPNGGTWTMGEMKPSISRFILLSERIKSGTSTYNDFGGWDWCSLASGHPKTGEHLGGTVLNYLFFDGHVAGLKPDVVNGDAKNRWGFLPDKGDDRIH